MRLLSIWRTNLTTRLVTTFVLLALIAVGILGSITLLAGTSIIRDSVFNQLESIARFKENEIERWIDDQQTEIAILSRSDDFRLQASDLISLDGYIRTEPDIEAQYQSMNRLLLPLTTLDSNFKEVSILHIDTGKVVYSTLPANEGTFNITAPYFIQGRNEVYIQNIYPSPLNLEPTMTIAAPIYNQQGRTVGVLAVNLNLARLDEIIKEDLGFGTNSDSYLVDRYNDMVSQEMFDNAQLQRGIFTEGINAAMQESDGLGMYQNKNGVPVIGAYRWINKYELILVAEVTQSEALSPARQLALIITGLAIIVSIVITIAIVLLARRITQPIRSLTLATEQVAAGDLSVRTPVMTNDELGLLARSFNLMTDQLQQLYSGMELNVTQLATTQEKLLSSETKYRSFIEYAPEGIFQITHGGEWITANPALAELCGFKSAELLMQRMRLEQLFVNPQDYRVLQRTLLKDDWLSHFETQFYHREGHTFWVNISIRAVHEFSINTTYYEGLARDITLNKQAEQDLQLYHDQLEQQVAARTRDLQSTNDELQRLARELNDKNVHLQQGLRLAHDIQLGLLPERPPWDIKRLAAYGQSLPSDEVGGDFYSFVKINDSEVFVAVGDISGKGVGAALMMALTSSLLEQRAMHDTSVVELMDNLHEQLTPRLQANHMNAALLCMRVNMQTYEVTVANAGMISPIVVHGGKLGYIDVVGPPIGSRLPFKRTEMSFTLQPNSYVVLMSDGAIEATNTDNEMWGFERFEGSLLFYQQQQEPERLIDDLFRDVASWQGKAATQDDITLVVLHRPAA